MSLADILDPSRVTVTLEASDKERTLEVLAGLLASSPGLPDPPTIARALAEREARGTTAVGRGVAIPHGRLDGVHASIGALAVSPSGVDFDSTDGEPVFLFFSFLTPRSGGHHAAAEHLRTLARVARPLRDDRTRSRLRDARTPKEVLALLRDW